MGGTSSQPLFDAAAGSSDGSIPQVDFTPAGVALDASGAPIGTASAFSVGGFSLSSVPWWAWALLAGVVAIRVLKL